MEVLGDDDDGVTGVRLQSTTEPSEETTLGVAGVFLELVIRQTQHFSTVSLSCIKEISFGKIISVHRRILRCLAAGDVADDYYRRPSLPGTGAWRL